MKTRPILFNGEMVRAILDGRKTQTRRVIKPQPVTCDRGPAWAVTNAHRMKPCPYGVPGDRLWVRETWATDGVYDDTRPVLLDEFIEPFYRASGESASRWRPSIHMPRWASRITLEVLSVRVERVQDITITDATAEGRKLGDPTAILQAALDAEAEDWAMARAAGFSQQEIEDGESGGMLAIYWFRRLWDTINAKRGYGWAANPWVWVVGSKVVGG